MSVWPEELTIEIDETAVQTVLEWPANMVIEIEGGTPGAKGEPGDPGVVTGVSPPAETNKVWVDTS